MDLNRSHVPGLRAALAQADTTTTDSITVGELERMIHEALKPPGGTPCQARQTSDQMTCSCGNVWDMNDPEPPACRTATPNYLEHPTFDESCDFEPVGVAGGSLIERYEELVRENKRLKAQLQTFRQSHYQTQAALARSAIAGEEIMVNTPGDVYTLPMQPSGLTSGPRFVAHVPAQQPCPESIREGAPYDDPAFEALCREYEIWGTPAAAQCAVFWEAGKRVAEQQPAPDVGELIEALEELMLRAHPAYVHDDLMREKLIAARELGHAALSSHREQQPAPDVAMRVMEALAAILRKAQGRTDTETGECIDVGAECMALRREFDRSSKAARGVSGLVEAAEAALGEIEDIMQEAYNSAYPVCCGRAGSECCGSPDPEWDEVDQRMMDRLAQHQKALSAALAAHRKGGEV